MSFLDRRKFIGTSVGLGAGLTAHAALSAPAETQPAGTPDGTANTPLPSVQSADPPPPPIIQLGQTGVKMSRLGQGTGVHGGQRQSNQTRLGFAELVGLFRHAYLRGIRFFDLADLYGTHIYFREALRDMPREEVAILSKIWWPYDGPRDNTSLPHRRQACKSAVERFRHELNTDYVDIVLLHCLTDPEWPSKMEPYMDVLDEEKQAGRVKAVGVSCHDLGALKTAAQTPWVDVILARVNPKGIKMDASTSEVVTVLRQAKAAGKAIIGMKIFGEGQLAERREECIRFAQGLEFLDAMTIGFEKQPQIDDVLRLMAKHPPVASA